MLTFAAQAGLAIIAAYLLAQRTLPLRSAVGRALAVCAGVPLLVIPLATVLGAVGQLNAFALGLCLLATILIVGRSLQTHRLNAVDDTAEGDAASAEMTPALLASTMSRATVGIVLVLAGHFAYEQLLAAWHPIADDLSYHATAAAHWVRARELVFAPYDYHAYFPANAELFAAWLVMPSRVDAYAGVAGLFWGAMCALAAAYLCARGQVAQRSATLASALILACEPLLQQAASFAAVELAATALVTAAAAFALSEDARRFPVARAFYCGGLCGLAIGCKVSYAPAAALIGVSLIWNDAALGPAARSRAWRALRAGALFALSACACGGFWYLRNWILTRNPFFPAAIGFWEGPLDALTQQRTSLAYQLSRLSGVPLSHALTKLMDWPVGLCLLSLLGYVGTLVRLATPGGRRDPHAFAWRVVLAIGVAEALVFAFGPFSGTADSGSLLIRSRFFVAFIVQGLCLWAGIAGRGSLRQAASLFILILGSAIPAALCVGAVGGVIGCSLLARLRRPVVLERRFRVAAFAALLAVALTNVSWAIEIRQARTDNDLRRSGKAFKALSRLKSGTRIGFFANFTPQRYYPLFGRRWQLAPVAVAPNGSEYQPLHLDWRARPTFLAPQPTSLPYDDLLQNLRLQRLEYVALIGPAPEEWASQTAQLRATPSVSVVVDAPSLVLFKLDSGRRPKRPRPREGRRAPT